LLCHPPAPTVSPTPSAKPNSEMIGTIPLMATRLPPIFREHTGNMHQYPGGAYSVVNRRIRAMF